MSKKFDSEIIRQKKQFVFNVRQSSNYVFPAEEYTYLIYVKNISEQEIENFNIKIEAPKEVFIESRRIEEDSSIKLEKNDTLLYELKASVQNKGKYIVHFIGYGESSQIIHRSLEINCSRSYNSDKLIHKIHIYDFTPYENNFSMEATNYSDEVTQTFKRQKLPYKAGEQPFPLQYNKIKDSNNNWIEDEHFHIENRESQSYLDQYKEAKNTKEHVYQYITRENFTDDSVENYEGENLYDIIKQINSESEYFNAKFLKTGTNKLLNDFTQYKPNGFIYRMGLLTSEIYHTLGVIPTYDYMSDRLFRWAPSATGQKIFYDRDIDEMDPTDTLLNLYPQPRSMKWGENVWAGKGFIVYKIPTEEFKKTEEFKEGFKENLISLREVVNSFEERKDAEKFIEEQEYFDDVIRNQQENPLIKYEYEIEESLYETGIFFVNLPIDKIPSNFYMPDTKELYNIINRVKPYGVKPIINYVIEREFNLDLSYKVTPDYKKEFLYNLNDFDIKYNIYKNTFINKNIQCHGETVSLVEKKPTKCVFYNTDFELNPIFDVDYSQVGIDFGNNNPFTADIEQKNIEYFNEKDQVLDTTNNIIELLYNNNYNNISFKIISDPFDKIPMESSREFSEQNGSIYINNLSPSIDSIKLPIYSKTEEKTLFIEDSFNRIHKIKVYFDQSKKMYNIQYIYQNSKGEEYLRKEGMEEIAGVVIGISKYNNRKILIFMVEDKNKEIHYFNHVIVEDVLRVGTLNNGKEMYEELMYKSFLLDYPIEIETPFCYCIERFSPIIRGGENWNNLYRLNEDTTSYTYIQNNKESSITPDSIYLFFDEINIPKTSIVKDVCFNLEGNSSKKEIFLDQSIGQNYRVDDINGYSIQLKPTEINNYSQDRESNSYYQIKLDEATDKEQETLINYYKNLMDENEIFDEDLKIKTSDYLDEYEDYITISKGFWNELSGFTNLEYNLNEVNDIFLVIEGFNAGDEVELLSQVILETNLSSTVRTRVPSGYFFLEVPLLYANNFLLNLFRVRFRFYGLNHDIKIFNTLIDVNFKNKQIEDVDYSFVEEFSIDKKQEFTLIENCIYPTNINNGLSLKLSFDDIDSGNFYQLNKSELSILYKDTDVELMVNKNKYRYKPTGESHTTVSGKESDDSYVSGLFYNDVSSISQILSDNSFDNQGIELQDTIFQAFEARENNITSIEIFPNGFVGNPDETLKIGIYTNHQNTPDKLIKEIYGNGWSKGNKEINKLPSIKYNLNVDNLTINETYWIKIQVLNPRDNSYYLLKSINQTQPRHKLLYRKNNNYINTFSSLTFNIYSKNLSISFGDFPAVQEFFDNPYILIGLHRGVGTIKNLNIGKWISTAKEDNHMKENLDIEPEVIINDKNNGIGITIKNNDTEEILIANFESNKWDVKEEE